MSKLIEVQATKEFASTFLPDIFFKMAVNRVLDAAPGVDLVRCKECKHCDKSAPEGYWYCKDHEIGSRCEDDYCSDGERKLNEQDKL